VKRGLGEDAGIDMTEALEGNLMIEHGVHRDRRGRDSLRPFSF
jgi:hypothetical protein